MPHVFFFFFLFILVFVVFFPPPLRSCSVCLYNLISFALDSLAPLASYLQTPLPSHPFPHFSRGCDPHRSWKTLFYHILPGKWGSNEEMERSEKKTSTVEEHTGPLVLGSGNKDCLDEILIKMESGLGKKSRVGLKPLKPWSVQIFNTMNIARFVYLKTCM